VIRRVVDEGLGGEVVDDQRSELLDRDIFWHIQLAALSARHRASFGVGHAMAAKIVHKQRNFCFKAEGGAAEGLAALHPLQHVGASYRRLAI